MSPFFLDHAGTLTVRITQPPGNVQLDAFRENLQVTLFEELDPVGWAIASDAIQLAPHAFGNLRASISHKVIVEQMVVQLVVGSDAIYAAAVEYGSRPHWPPWSASNPDAEPLRRWAQRFLGDADLAYAVARKIAREGTDPQPFLEPAFEVHYNHIVEAIERAVQRAMSMTIEGA